MDTCNISSFLLTLPKEKGKHKKRRVWENDTWHRQPGGGVTGSGGNCVGREFAGPAHSGESQVLLSGSQFWHAWLALPDFLVTQEKPEKSQVLNAGNYLTFLRSSTKEGPPSAREIVSLSSDRCSLCLGLFSLIFLLKIKVDANFSHQ